MLDRGARADGRRTRDTLRSSGLTVTGPADDVAAFVADREVVARQQLGRTAQATLVGAAPTTTQRARGRPAWSSDPSPCRTCSST